MKGAPGPRPPVPVPAPGLTGSEVSRRRSLTQHPGQRRTDRGFGPLITSAPSVPHPETRLDSRKAEPNPTALDAVAIFCLLVTSRGGEGGRGLLGAVDGTNAERRQ